MSRAALTHIRKIPLTVLVTILALTAVLAAGLPSQSARAQNLQRIAAVVNDEIVTLRDLRSRVQMVIVTSQLPDTPETAQRLAPQVLRSLIDEQLQLQEAERLNVAVTEEDLARAQSTVEERNNLRPGQLPSFLARLGIDPDTVERQQRANIAFSKLVRRRYGGDVAVSNDDVQDEIDRIADQAGKTQKRVSEILLTVESPEQEEETRQLAERLVEEIRRGAPFDGVARQFSQASSAATGGDIGWVLPETLGQEIEDTVANLPQGTISAPIRTVFGYHILAVSDERVIAASDPTKTQLTLKQVFLPVPRNADAEARASQRSLAEAVTSTATSCADMGALAEEVQSPVESDLGPTTLAELPAEYRQAVADLDVGQTTPPLDLPTGVVVLMVCEKDAAGGNLPDAEQVRRQLEQRRFETLAQRYLRDLRRAAFVEVRV